MSWIIIIIVIGAFITFKMSNTYKQNKSQEELLEVFKKHSPEEIFEIAQGQLQYKIKLAKTEQLYKSGQITNDELELLLAETILDHGEILKKYNVTEKEMENYYILTSSIK